MVPLIFLSIIFFQFDSGVSASACGRSGRSISSTEDKECKFPFTYMNTTYSSCTWRMSDRTHGLPWCSVMVDSDGVHVNKKDGSTWINCDSECPIPSLVCRTPGSRCNEDGIMQVCDEMLKGVHFATWCVNEVNGKSIHKNCPEICEEGAVVKVLHQIDSDAFSFCEGKGTECFVYMFSSLVLFVCLLFSIIVIIVIILKNQPKKEIVHFLDFFKSSRIKLTS